MKKIILSNIEDVKDILEEEKYQFIRDIFLQMNLPIEDIFPENFKDQTVEQRIEQRRLLNKFDIEVVKTDCVQIYLDGNLMAEMKKPSVKLKEDLSVKSRTNRHYMEIEIEYNSPFEELNENN